LALAIALQGTDFLNAQLGTLSAASILPAAVGMALGQRFRRKFSEQLFTKMFFATLFLLGAYIIANASFGIK